MGWPAVDCPHRRAANARAQNIAGVDVQQTSNGEICRQVFLVLKMDASVPVDSRVFMQKRALRKYLVDSGELRWESLTQRMHEHGKMLVQAISAAHSQSKSAVTWKRRCDLISKRVMLTLSSTKLPSGHGTKLYLRPTMLNVFERQTILTLYIYIGGCCGHQAV